MNLLGAIIDALVGISQYLPEIKKPEKEVPFKEKMMWTLLALIIFLVLSRIFLFGLDPTVAQNQQLAMMQLLLASEIGTVITAGIGPIVMASIFLQLFLGAKLINLDIGSQEGRAKFQQLQKILAVLLCFIEAFIYVGSGLLVPLPGMMPIILLQIAFGSLILLYLDEIVSKYGIGSGISLFIAAGVTAGLFWQTFSFPIADITQGGMLYQFFVATPGEWLVLLPLVGVLAIFLVVVFAEGMHVNIPITMGYRGTGGRYPVKFLYVSNMPVILASALFMNMRLWAMFVEKIPIIGPIFDALAWATMFPSIGNTQLFHAVSTGGGSLIAGVVVEGITTATMNALIQSGVFMILLIIACVVFGWFWVQMGNQSTEAVAAQLERSGMQIPGFRKDKRVIEQVLMRYIPPITILGSIFVAILAGGGDFVLAGIASGTGILLTVGIIYRFYEEIAKTQQETLAKYLGKIA